MGLVKSKEGVGVFQISQKERRFHLLWQPSTLGVYLIMQSPFLHPSKNPSSPLQFGQENIIPGHSIERRTYWFILKIARMFLIHLSRNRMMRTFIIVNKHYPLSPEIRLCISPFQKGLPSPFSLARNRIYFGTHLKEELINLFWKLPMYSLLIPIQAE